MTGSLLSAAPGCRLTGFSAGGIVPHVPHDSAGLFLTGVCQVFRIVLRIYSWTEVAMGSVSPADDRSGVDFNFELQVPWNTPEAYVNLDSYGVYELKTVLDILGLHARRPGAAVVKVLLCDSSSVRALVPDARVIDRGFHEITLVDVFIADLSLLRLQWPIPVLSSMFWLQPELEQLRTTT